MNPPRRLLSDPQADPLVRKLLSSARPIKPPPEAPAQVWAALAPQLDLPPVGPPAPPAPPAEPLAGASAAGSVAVFVKPALLGALATVALLGGSSLLTAPPAPSAPAARSVAALTAPEPVASVAPEPARLDLPEPSPRASAERAALAPAALVVATNREAPAVASASAPAASALPEPVASVAPAEQERIERLREEARLVRKGRDALGRGDFSGALRWLGQAQAMQGVLYQESEALTIEALARSGQREAASTRARAFLTAYPQSPHAARLQPLAGP